MIPALPHIPSGPALLGGLLVMSLLRSLGAGIQAPAVNAAIPQLVPEDQLMRYNGLNAAMQSLVNFAAPAAGFTATADAYAPCIPGILELTRVHNYGAAWSSFSGMRWLLSAVTAAVTPPMRQRASAAARCRDAMSFRPR